MTDCLFCKIVAGDIDSDIVRETENVVAFRDINPGAPTHVLVIPREHIASASDLDRGRADLIAELFEVMAEVARSEDLEGGHRIVTNVGADAGQSVHHVHFHVLGGRALSWPPG